MGDVTDEELDREIAPLERHEREIREGQWAIKDAVRERFADVLAGTWVEDDQKTYVVAVTDRVDEVALALTNIAPVPLKIVQARYTLDELEKLSEQLWTAADELSAPLAATGVSEDQNAVNVRLRDLAAAPSRVLRERFAGRPIMWIEDDIVPA